ncbi:MAG: hypothetical protein IPJ37_06650 [Bacteroidales bacterium]|nr:hypothetical protein [Bacteroidales bacterium]
MMENSAGYISESKNQKTILGFPDPSFFTLINEVGLNFFRFMRSLDISQESNLVVLSSKDNYFCDERELKNARVIVNLKRLNLIKHLDLFLNSLVRTLPPNTNFIGYFSDEESANRFTPGNIFRTFKKIFKTFSSRRNHVMNRNEVTDILEKNGFKTLNMKKMNGHTYFISQNISLPQ